MDFTGKAALVTGSSRGIGAAVARQLAGLGARVALHYGRNRSAAGQALGSLAGEGHVVVGADLADPEAVAGMVDETLAGLGRIDVLVNNAAVYLEHRITDVTYAEWQDRWRRTIDTNLIGAANVTYCVVRHMLDRGGGGRIVNVSSRGAFRGEPDFPAYGASKAGLNSTGQSLAQHLAPHGIFVTTVAPGFVETDMAAPFLDSEEGDAIRGQSPLGRAGTPEEVAYVVAFLASEGADYATGAIIDVNGASYLRT